MRSVPSPFESSPESFDHVGVNPSSELPVMTSEYGMLNIRSNRAGRIESVRYQVRSFGIHSFLEELDNTLSGQILRNLSEDLTSTLDNA